MIEALPPEELIEKAPEAGIQDFGIWWHHEPGPDYSATVNCPCGVAPKLWSRGTPPPVGRIVPVLLREIPGRHRLYYFAGQCRECGDRHWTALEWVGNVPDPRRPDARLRMPTWGESHEIPEAVEVAMAEALRRLEGKIIGPPREKGPNDAAKYARAGFIGLYRTIPVGCPST